MKLQLVSALFGIIFLFPVWVKVGKGLSGYVYTGIGVLFSIIIMFFVLVGKGMKLRLVSALFGIIFLSPILVRFGKGLSGYIYIGIGILFSIAIMFLALWGEGNDAIDSNLAARIIFFCPLTFAGWLCFFATNASPYVYYFTGFFCFSFLFMPKENFYKHLR
jgi:hypothetical protein